VPLSGPPAQRGHLRLAPPPAEPARPDARVLLYFRAAVASLALAFATVVAWTSGALALVPLLWRRSPVGGRLRPLHAREARVIPFQPRRAQPQQQALPR
jgi:hypothetical protein